MKNTTESIQTYNPEDTVRTNQTLILARQIVECWPQQNYEKKWVHYAFNGHVATTMDTLSDGSGIVDSTHGGMPYSMPFDVRETLLPILREANDVDLEAYSSDPDIPSTRPAKYRTLTFLTTGYPLFLSHAVEFDRTWRTPPIPFSRVTTPQGEFICARFDYVAVIKLLCVPKSHDKKPDQLNKDVPVLMRAARAMFGDGQVDMTVREVFTGIKDREGYIESVSQTARDPKISEAVLFHLRNAIREARI
jgi:hypothetical protein